MTLEFKKNRLKSQYNDDARLVIIDGELTAVLVRISDIYGEMNDRWYLEAGFGALRNQEPTFADLNEASAWIQQQVREIALEPIRRRIAGRS